MDVADHPPTGQTLCHGHHAETRGAERPVLLPASHTCGFQHTGCRGSGQGRESFVWNWGHFFGIGFVCLELGSFFLDWVLLGLGWEGGVLGSYGTSFILLGLASFFME